MLILKRTSLRTIDFIPQTFGSKIEYFHSLFTLIFKMFWRLKIVTMTQRNRIVEVAFILWIFCLLKSWPTVLLLVKNAFRDWSWGGKGLLIDFQKPYFRWETNYLVKLFYVNQSLRIQHLNPLYYVLCFSKFYQINHATGRTLLILAKLEKQSYFPIFL